MNNIGQRIKEKRELLGLSQQDLANKLGYKSRSSINKIELGVNDIPQSRIVAFAKALDTTPAYLMGWEGKKTPSPDDESVYVIKDEKAKIMLKWFESLPDHQQDLAIALLRSALDQVSKQEKNQ